jgi:hypothetical protein
MCYKGYKMSEESKKKMSAFQKTKTISQETRKKLSEKGKGRKHTDSAKEKIRQFHIGKPVDISVRNKISKTLTGRNVGENNPFWKGGVTKISKRIRVCVPYREWRSSVFERDSYTCQFCNAKGVYLNADHYPVLFSEIMLSFNIKTMKDARNCELLWDINNGRTLCRECHLKVTFNK